MQYELKEIKTEERKLVFRLEDSDPCAFHLIGYMRGDYGKTGDRFYHTWFGNDDSKNDAAFKSELHHVFKRWDISRSHYIEAGHAPEETQVVYALMRFPVFAGQSRTVL